MAEREEGDFKRRPIPESQRYLCVDITFDDSPPANQSKQSLPASPSDIFDQTMQTKTHLGLQSCALVQYYIANYKHLKPVAILLKRFLAIHNFNSPYYGKRISIDETKGGLSSYSAVILLVAYMNYFGLKTNHYY